MFDWHSNGLIQPISSYVGQILEPLTGPGVVTLVAGSWEVLGNSKRGRRASQRKCSCGLRGVGEATVYQPVEEKLQPLNN